MIVRCECLPFLSTAGAPLPSIRAQLKGRTFGRCVAVVGWQSVAMRAIRIRNSCLEDLQAMRKRGSARFRPRVVFQKPFRVTVDLSASLCWINTFIHLLTCLPCSASRSAPAPHSPHLVVRGTPFAGNLIVATTAPLTFTIAMVTFLLPRSQALQITQCPKHIAAVSFLRSSTLSGGRY